MIEKEIICKSFADQYLEAAAAMSSLEEKLGWIGMSGNRAFTVLQKEFLRHGELTLQDISRDKSGPEKTDT